MKQIDNSMLCKYCCGCCRLEDENFIGVKNCKGFAPDHDDWIKRRYENIKEDKKNVL